VRSQNIIITNLQNQIHIPYNKCCGYYPKSASVATSSYVTSSYFKYK